MCGVTFITFKFILNPGHPPAAAVLLTPTVQYIIHTTKAVMIQQL
jgi:hypothetical protein